MKPLLALALTAVLATGCGTNLGPAMKVPGAKPAGNVGARAFLPKPGSEPTPKPVGVPLTVAQVEQALVKQYGTAQGTFGPIRFAIKDLVVTPVDPHRFRFVLVKDGSAWDYRVEGDYQGDSNFHYPIRVKETVIGGPDPACKEYGPLGICKDPK